MGMRFAEKKFKSTFSVDLLMIYGVPVFLGIFSMMGRLPDRNFDRRNAYDYNAWAFLENRYSQDWMPSGLGSYLNPIVNIPAYLIGMMPIIFSFLYGIAFLIIYLHFILKILDLIDSDGLLKVRRNRIAFAIISSASPLFLAELGTSMSGYTSSVFVIIGIYFFIKGMRQDSKRNFFISGLLIGLGVHFKMVNAGALLAILPCFIFVGAKKLMSFTQFILGFIGTSIIFLPWYIFVYSKFNNPVFPLFNGIFNSPYYPNVNFKDQRWSLDSPEKFLQLLSGLWARINTEIPAFDLRIFLVSALALILFANAKMVFAKLNTDKTQLVLLVWFFLFTVFWVETSFIARYFMPGELMIVVIFFILSKFLLEKSIFEKSGFLIIAFVIASVMQIPNWNTWQEQFLGENANISKVDQRWQFPKEVTVPAGSQILTLGEPISYTFKYFPRDVRFINVGWPKYNSGIEITPPSGIVDSIKKVSTGNLFLTALPLKDPKSLEIANDYLAIYGLQITINSCKTFRTSSEEFMLCRLENA
jgi:hypothetical protein